jgi:hypothetical protein
LLVYDLESRDICEHSNLFDLSDEDNRKLSKNFFNSLNNSAEMNKAIAVPEKTNYGYAGKSIYDYVKNLTLS